jgi:hypothetical protein
MCQFLSAIGADDLVAIADMADGSPVYENFAHWWARRINGHA